MSKKEDMWHEDILGGCVETLYRVGKHLYVGETKIGSIEDSYYPQGKYRVEPGDLRYGCCGDIIIRPDGDSFFLVEPEEDYFYAKLGEKFTFTNGYRIKLVDGWQTIVREYLKPYDAEFVFGEVS